jgi:O-antigen/teichoic acid export membrane protein
LKSNFFSSLFNNFIGVFLVIFLTPVYLNILGIESYGLIGFYISLLGVLSLVDFGLSTTLKKELAVYKAKNLKAESVDLLKSFEFLLLIFCLTVSIVIYSLAPLIQRFFLTIANLDPKSIILAVKYMGFSISASLLTSFYIAGLYGIQNINVANILLILLNLMRSLGVVVILLIFPSDIIVYFQWQLIINVLFLIICRQLLLKRITPFDSNYFLNFDINLIRKNFGFSLNVFVISIISVFLLQSDKFVVSKFLSLSELSYYTIATTISTIPLLLANSISSVLFPEFSKSVSLKSKSNLDMLYVRGVMIIRLLIMPISITLIFFSQEFIFAWTGSNLISLNTYRVAQLLLISQFFQSYTLLPFNIALAHGNTSFSRKAGYVSIILFIPLLLLLTSKYGILGTSLSWLIFMFIASPLNVYFLLKQEYISTISLKSTANTFIQGLIYLLPLGLVFKYVTKFSNSRLILSIELLSIWFIFSVIIFFNSKEIKYLVISKIRSAFNQ